MALRQVAWKGVDIIVGEGRQIVSVDPARLPALDIGESADHFIAMFLVSDRYAQLPGKESNLRR